MPRLRRPGGLLLPDWLAITLGGHIWSWRPLGAPELEHEVTHVRQWARYGWRYPLLYALASLRARRTGGHWYRDNRFEREAREAAAAVVSA
jgi:hypothetical protein